MLTKPQEPYVYLKSNICICQKVRKNQKHGFLESDMRVVNAKSQIQLFKASNQLRTKTKETVNATYWAEPLRLEACDAPIPPMACDAPLHPLLGKLRG